MEGERSVSVCLEATHSPLPANCPCAEDIVNRRPRELVGVLITILLLYLLMVFRSVRSNAGSLQK